MSNGSDVAVFSLAFVTVLLLSFCIVWGLIHFAGFLVAATGFFASFTGFTAGQSALLSGVYHIVKSLL